MVPIPSFAVLAFLSAPSPSLAAVGQPLPPGADAGASVAAVAVAAVLVAASLTAMALALRTLLRHRRGPPPLARLLLAGSLYEANLPRSRRFLGEG
jgi:hypothetical protein